MAKRVAEDADFEAYLRALAVELPGGRGDDGLEHGDWCLGDGKRQPGGRVRAVELMLSSCPRCRDDFEAHLRTGYFQMGHMVKEALRAVRLTWQAEGVDARDTPAASQMVGRLRRSTNRLSATHAGRDAHAAILRRLQEQAERLEGVADARELALVGVRKLMKGRTTFDETPVVISFPGALVKQERFRAAVAALFVNCRVSPSALWVPRYAAEAALYYLASAAKVPVERIQLEECDSELLASVAAGMHAQGEDFADLGVCVALARDVLR